MSSYRPILFATTLASSLAACADTTTQPPQDLPGPSLEGATVEQGPVRLLAFSTDVESGYAVVIGGTPEEIADFCATGSVATAEQRWRDLAVFLPTGGVRFRDLGRDVPLVVYQGDDPACTGAPVYAIGTGNAVLIERPFSPAPGAPGLYFTANGIVTTTQGESFRLHLTAHVVFPPSGAVRELSKITLRPLH